MSRHLVKVSQLRCANEDARLDVDDDGPGLLVRGVSAEDSVTFLLMQQDGAVALRVLGEGYDAVEWLIGRDDREWNACYALTAYGPVLLSRPPLPDATPQPGETPEDAVERTIAYVRTLRHECSDLLADAFAGHTPSTRT